MSLSTKSIQRNLGEDENGYFSDADGNAYEPYSLAWRYLGLFIDCSSSSSNNNNDRRKLNENDKDGSSLCQRRLLWAAYHDEKYRGGTIGEYSIYDRRSHVWETRTCRAQTWWPFTRCKRMDCHQRHTSWKLVGVYKETDGLEDWAEQLFKHQGYCLWGADQDEDGSGSGDSQDREQYSSDYEFMQDYRENWNSYCQQLENAVDADGNYLYVAAKPIQGGDMTMGLYTDSSCLVESTIQWTDYLEAYGGDGDNGDSELTWQSSVDRWNDLLGDYKVCQPCRAYSLSPSGGGSHDGSGDEEDGDDGEGGAEKWGFNCYDDAGYQNCNQCYKFATQTDMEEASIDDLQEATSQGTILAIRVDGKMYGSGRPRDVRHAAIMLKRTSISLLAVGVIVGFCFLYYKFVWLSGRRVQNISLKDDLTVKTQNDTDSSSDENRRPAQRRSRNRHGSARDRTDPPSSRSQQQNMWVQIRARDVRLEQQAKEIDELRRELEWYKERATKRASPVVEHSETF